MRAAVRTAGRSPGPGRRRESGGGAAVCVYYDGEPVADFYAGATYRVGTRQLVFSVAKAVSAIAAHVAAANGELDLDRPLATYWQAFDRPDTRAITARTVLVHRAGLPAVDQPLAISEIIGGGLEHALEHQDPYWEPGTAHGYHTITFGTLLDGSFQRVLGATVSEYAHRHMVAPLGLRMSYGLPADSADVTTLRSPGTVAPALPNSASSPSTLLDAAAFGLLRRPHDLQLRSLVHHTVPGRRDVPGGRCGWPTPKPAHDLARRGMP